ncbi:MAG: cupredoxin domain-containing protein [Spirochaetota bacterium]
MSAEQIDPGSRDADQAYDSLIKSGYDDDVASIVRDQLRVKQLESYAEEIRELLAAKSELVRAKAGELYRVLAESVGLNHTLPTSSRVQHRNLNDTVDLSVAVSRSDRGSHVRFVWKTHNIHVIDTIPEGFALGDLNIGKRREHTVETQIPILAMTISAGPDDRKTLFSTAGDDPGGLEVTFNLNRSWIEERSTASDAQFDSAFGSPLDFLDFLSDNAHNPVYAMLMHLIAETSEVLSRYLDRKRSFIQNMDL